MIIPFGHRVSTTSITVVIIIIVIIIVVIIIIIIIFIIIIVIIIIIIIKVHLFHICGRFFHLIYTKEGVSTPRQIKILSCNLLAES
jgi:hypothetical protein